MDGDTTSLVEWVLLLPGFLAMCIPTFFLMRQERLSGKELSKKHPRYGWMRWGFAVLYIVWAVVLFIFLFPIFANADFTEPQAALAGSSMFAGMGLFHGLFAIRTGVCPVSRGHRDFFVLGAEARRVGRIQVIWSLMVIIVTVSLI